MTPHQYAAEVRARRAALPCACPSCVQADMLPAVRQILASSIGRKRKPAVRMVKK